MSEVLVITGASRGIGLATARLFQARGARVVNLSRSACPLAGVVHIEADFGAGTVTDEVERSLRAALGALGDANKITVVHNAALMTADTARDVDGHAFARSLAIGVLAPAALNRVLLPRMGRGSSIVYVGSTLSEKAVPGSFSYVTMKHAVIGMMRATCQDLLGSGVHTACVCPGITDTEMLRAHVKHDEAILAALRTMTGDGRLIEPDEIAKVIAFAADHAVLNGTVVHANLGQRER